MATNAERITALETKVSSLQTAVASLQTAMTSAQNAITALKAADVSKGSRIKALEDVIFPPPPPDPSLPVSLMVAPTYDTSVEDDTGFIIASPY
jgi:hypothetical protein